tara:strand:- start:165 stop:302 length:138 start_codon:yes stop_codon:yes gene_type:complete
LAASSSPKRPTKSDSTPSLVTAQLATAAGPPRRFSRPLASIFMGF